MNDDYDRYRRALGDEPLPAALVDLDRIDRNVETLTAPLRRAGKTLRVATKSLRCEKLERYVLERAGTVGQGLLAYSAREAVWLHGRGLDDVLVAYPTAQRADWARVAEVVAEGARISMVVDHAVHLDRAREAARACRARLPLVVDVDVSYRPLGDALPLGVKRSPLHDPEDVAAFVAEITRSPELVFAGLLAYEAHVAGVPDRSGGAPVLDAAKRLVKERAIQAAKLQRAAIVDALRARGIAVPLFDGGGSGSVHLSALDPSLTEIAAGSGFVDSHLFDGYRGLPLAPAAFFALEVTREPRPGIVTCQSGGFVASGAAGVDRLPRPALPEGLSLTGLEGAGEVQTPLVVPRGVRLGVGDPVFFRHAKAGELAEHFDEYLFVRGDRVVDRAKTYRGEGHAFH